MMRNDPKLDLLADWARHFLRIFEFFSSKLIFSSLQLQSFDCFKARYISSELY